MIKQQKLIDEKNEKNESKDLTLKKDDIGIDEKTGMVIGIKTEEEMEEEMDEEEYEEQVEYDPDNDYRKIQTLVTYEDEDYIRLAKLNERVDEIFLKSRWSIINPNKKIPKDLIPLMFQDILKELEDDEFTMVEKFVAICDYAGINYLKAYEAIHIKYKELIVQEMDRKYKILKKKGIKKIF